MGFGRLVNHCFDEWSIYILVGRYRIEAIGIRAVHFFHRLHFLAFSLHFPSCCASGTIAIGITCSIRVFIVPITIITAVVAIAFIDGSLCCTTSLLNVFKFLGIVIEFVTTAASSCSMAAATITTSSIRVDMFSGFSKAAFHFFLCFLLGFALGIVFVDLIHFTLTISIAQRVVFPFFVAESIDCRIAVFIHIAIFHASHLIFHTFILCIGQLHVERVGSYFSRAGAVAIKDARHLVGKKGQWQENNEGKDVFWLLQIQLLHSLRFFRKLTMCCSW